MITPKEFSEIILQKMVILKKRLTALFTAAVVACTSTTAYAHNEDLSWSTYRGRSSAEFVLRIEPSARNEVLTTSAVYNHGTDWNGISSNVKLSVVSVGGGTPTILNQLCVYGKDKGGTIISNSDADRVIFTAGETVFYDENGKVVDIYTNCVWSEIEMNTNAKIMKFFAERPDYAKPIFSKAFRHEVGHALKLTHPLKNSDLHTNKYGGYPEAIMNPGDPGGEEYVSPTITEHDKACLRKRWGA